MPAKDKPLSGDAEKVLRALDPEYEYLVLVVPMRAGLNELAAGAALAELKTRKLVAFEGRGKFKSVYLTDEGGTARAELEAPAGNGGTADAD